jgi:hypothetical protein
MSPLDGTKQRGIVKKRFAAFEIDPRYRVEVFGLFENLIELRERKRALLFWAPPGKTMIALVYTFV